MKLSDTTFKRKDDASDEYIETESVKQFWKRLAKRFPQERCSCKRPKIGKLLIWAQTKAAGKFKDKPNTLIKNKNLTF